MRLDFMAIAPAKPRAPIRSWKPQFLRFQFSNLTASIMRTALICAGKGTPGDFMNEGNSDPASCVDSEVKSY